MKLELQKLNWVKRRKPTDKPQAIAVDIPNLLLEREAKCDVWVDYEDGERRLLKGRVMFNEIKQTWSVSAIANGGWSVLVSVEK